MVDCVYPDYVSIQNDRDVEDWLHVCEKGRWDAVTGIHVSNTERLADFQCPFFWDVPVTSLEFFSNVTTWYDHVYLGELHVPDLTGLDGMVGVGQDLYIDTGGPIDLTGLESLVSVAGRFILDPDSGSTLRDLSGLDSLESVGASGVGSLEARHQHALIEVGPLPSLQAAGFYVGNNDSLKAFSTPPSLETLYDLAVSEESISSVSAAPLGGEVVGTLRLWDSPVLDDLSGFAPLSGVGQELEVSGNDSLTSLDGLHNLEWIGGTVTVEGDGD